MDWLTTLKFNYSKGLYGSKCLTKSWTSSKIYSWKVSRRRILKNFVPQKFPNINLTYHIIYILHTLIKNIVGKSKVENITSLYSKMMITAASTMTVSKVNITLVICACNDNSYRELQSVHHLYYCSQHNDLIKHWILCHLCSHHTNSLQITKLVVIYSSYGLRPRGLDLYSPHGYIYQKSF